MCWAPLVLLGPSAFAQGPAPDPVPAGGETPPAPAPGPGTPRDAAPAPAAPAPAAPALPFSPGPGDSGARLPLARPEVPEEALYDKVADQGDGKVEGRGRRRRDGEFVLYELPEARTVVRYERMDGRRVAEDHWFDSAGYPLATLFYDKGVAARAVVAGAPPVEVPLAGWTSQEVPGGALLLPAAPSERPGGGVRVDVLGGTLDVWLEPPVTPAADPLSDEFRDGLLAGCGCFVVDRATAWLDGRPGVRYRLLLPGAVPRDAVDLWAVSLGAKGLLLVSYTARSAADPVSALRPARAVLAGLDLR